MNNRPYLTEDELQNMYDDYLDEIYSDAGTPFNLLGSTVLEECDPIAYRCGLSDYADSLSEDYIIENYNDTDCCECSSCGTTIDYEEYENNNGYCEPCWNEEE